MGFCPSTSTFKVRSGGGGYCPSHPTTLGGSRQAKTIRMLLVVIIKFTLTEFPHGILILFSAIVPDFYTNVYLPLGDFMDLIALVNNAINDLLYCIMSTQFRSKVLQMYASFKDV